MDLLSPEHAREFKKIEKELESIELLQARYRERRGIVAGALATEMGTQIRKYIIEKSEISPRSIT